MSEERDRPTIPADLGSFARETERELRAVPRDLGPRLHPGSVPVLAMSLDEVKTLPLDVRAGRLLSLIDGSTSVEMLLDASGLPEDEVLDVLAKLLVLRVICMAEAT